MSFKKKKKIACWSLLVKIPLKSSILNLEALGKPMHLHGPCGFILKMRYEGLNQTYFCLGVSGPLWTPNVICKKKNPPWNSLVVQWLGLCASTAGGPGSIPGRGTKILQAALCSQKTKLWLLLFQYFQIKPNKLFFNLSKACPEQQKSSGFSLSCRLEL